MKRFQPFHLIARKNSKGKKVYYARFVDEETGETLFTRSTKVGNKTHAARIAEKILAEEQEKRAERPAQTVEQYFTGFYAPGGTYERKRKSKGYTVSPRYLNVCEGIVRNHIIPAWGGYFLRDLDVDEIDSWLGELMEDGELNPATINKVRKVFSYVLQNAVGEKLMKYNPVKYIKEVKETSKKRGVLTRGEVNLLFKQPEIWPTFSHYALNLLAYSTGMRMGELRGLTVENVHPDFIGVRYQWEDGLGLKAPKAESIRDIAIPPITGAALQKVIADTEPENIVFYSPENKAIPMSRSYIKNTFYTVLGQIGVTEDFRRKRNIVFHSYRHTLTTILRSQGIGDAKIQALTGHQSQEMVNNYTGFHADDFKDVSNVVSGLIEGKKRQR